MGDAKNRRRACDSIFLEMNFPIPEHEPVAVVEQMAARLREIQDAMSICGCSVCRVVDEMAASASFKPEG